MNELKPIYIVLTRPKTIVSDFIYLATRDKYTHSSLSLSPDLNMMYSFGRRFERLPLPGCFVCENFKSGIFARLRYVPGAIIRLDITPHEYEQLTLFLRSMLRNRHRYKYNYMGFVFFFFNIGRHTDYRYTCSEFVATALASSGIIKFENHLNLIKPFDLTSLPGKIVFEGDIKEYIRTEAYKFIDDTEGIPLDLLRETSNAVFHV